MSLSTSASLLSPNQAGIENFVNCRMAPRQTDFCCSEWDSSFGRNHQVLGKPFHSFFSNTAKTFAALPMI
jgi:hypothetical protein